MSSGRQARGTHVFVQDACRLGRVAVRVAARGGHIDGHQLGDLAGEAFAHDDASDGGCAAQQRTHAVGERCRVQGATAQRSGARLGARSVAALYFARKGCSSARVVAHPGNNPRAFGTCTPSPAPGWPRRRHSPAPAARRGGVSQRCWKLPGGHFAGVPQRTNGDASTHRTQLRRIGRDAQRGVAAVGVAAANLGHVDRRDSQVPPRPRHRRQNLRRRQRVSAANACTLRRVLPAAKRRAAAAQRQRARKVSTGARQRDMPGTPAPGNSIRRRPRRTSWSCPRRSTRPRMPAARRHAAAPACFRRAPSRHPRGTQSSGAAPSQHARRKQLPLHLHNSCSNGAGAAGSCCVSDDRRRAHAASRHARTQRSADTVAFARYATSHARDTACNAGATSESCLHIPNLRRRAEARFTPPRPRGAPGPRPRWRRRARTAPP